MKKHLFVMALSLGLVISGCSNPTPSSSSSSSGSSSDTSSTSSTSQSSSSSSSSQKPEPKTVSTAYALNSLKSSYYQENMKTEQNLGLSRMHEVGVDKDRFDNEYLYPVANEGTIYNVEDYNITVDGDNNSSNLNSLIQSLSSVSGNKIIKFNKGKYVFKSTINLTNANNVYLVGNETLWSLSSWTSFINCSNSTDIHINDIDFDINPSPTIAGTINSYNFKADGNLDVVVDVFDEFDLSASAYAAWSFSSQNNYTGSYMECTLDPVTGNYYPDINKNLFYNTTTTTDTYKGMRNIVLDPANRQLTITLYKSFAPAKLKTPTVGDHVSIAFTMYNYFGFAFTGCENVYVEHVNCYVTAGMGFRVNGGKNVYLNHTNFCIEEDSERIMTCTADIIHTISLENDLVMTNCLFEASHDDALNIKSFYCEVTNVVKSNNQINVQQTQKEVATTFEVGDKIDIFDTDTMGLIDSFTIVDYEKNGSNYSLIVDHRPKNIEQGFIVGNDTKATHMLLNNCVIRNKRNRGILLQARYSEVSNCCFTNVVMGSTNVLAVNDSFGEAIAPKSIIFKNNKFINNKGGDLNVFAYGSSSASIGTLSDITLENNFLSGNNSSPFWIKSVKESTINNNLVYYSGDFARTVVTIEYSKDLNVNNNCLYTGGSHSKATFVTADANSTNIVKNNNFMLGGN